MIRLSLIILAWLTASLLMPRAAQADDGEPFNLRIIQRGADGEPVTLDYQGTDYPNQTMGFAANGVFGPLTLLQTLPSGTALQVLRRNAANTGLEFADPAAGVTAGDKGDVTVSGLGVWTIDDAVITSAKIGDGEITNADISPSAAIADSKLATISSAGKVADSALSANVPLKNAANTFTASQTQVAAPIVTPTPMPALAIDMTKALNTKTLTANSALTYTGAVAGRQWTEVELTNTTAGALTITLSTATYDGGAGPLVPSLTLPAASGGVNGLRRFAIEYDGTRYLIHQGGGGGGSGDAVLAGGNAFVGNQTIDGQLSVTGPIYGTSLSGILDPASLPATMPARTYSKITTADAMTHSPTLVAATFGSPITIDVSKGHSVITLNETTETIAFSGTPPEGTPIVVRIVPHIVDCEVGTESIYSLNNGGNRLGFTVRGNKPSLWVLWRANGAWFSEEPYELGDLPDHDAPTTSYMLETYDPATGASGRSSLSQIIAGTALKTSRTGVRRTMYVNAGAMIPRTTAGATRGTVELATNDIMYDSMDFPTAAETGCGFWLHMPPTWNAGTVTAKFHWSASGGTAAQTVSWNIAARGFADDAALDQALGTEQAVTDALIATSDMHISSTSPAITVGGDNAANLPVYFQVTRDVANDDLAADARLLGVVIEYTESATEPSAQ